MNWNDIKNIIKEEVSVTADNTKFNLRTGVNKNPTKLGIKIQFEPIAGGLETDTKSKLTVALQKKLNDSLKDYDMQVSKDTDVPREDVIGFFIPLAQLKNLIVKSISGENTNELSIPSIPSEPVDENKDTLNEALRARMLQEISRVVKKDDFYGFINKGNNIIRDLEEAGFEPMEAKKYLKHLVAYNIM